MILSKIWIYVLKCLQVQIIKKIVSYIPLRCFHTLVSLVRGNERCFAKLNMDNDKKKYKVDFSLDTYDVFELEMMELGGIPLFFHVIKDILSYEEDSSFILETPNRKVIDYCKNKGVVLCNSEWQEDIPVVNAYQPFKFVDKKYALLYENMNLTVCNLQSYLYAKYLVEQIEQYEKSYLLKQQKVHSIIHRVISNCQVCLIGDSLVEYWMVDEISNMKIFNAGIGDLTSKECLELVDKIDLSSFKIFFIIIGTNDLKYKIPIDTIVNNIKSIIDLVLYKNPKARIIYSLVPNVRRRWDRRNDDINRLNIKLNEILGGMVSVLSLSFLNNIYGELQERNTIDGLHFSDIAYEKLQEIIESKIAEL